MTLANRFKSCILCGAIGDAYGSAYENQNLPDEKTYYLFGKPEPNIPEWRLTDDTQLTLATCQAITQNPNIDPQAFADAYLELYRESKITGIGASTLKSLKELDYGMDWRMAGNKGKHAAGNGAAMRIAPLAFLDSISNQTIRSISSITHNNDEAYTGALAIVISIRAIINEDWMGKENLIDIIVDQIPDTLVRDRLIEINNLKNIDQISEIGKLGSDGYVVNSVPLAIAAAQMAPRIGIKRMYDELIDVGGDTDTNCSMAGQIIGTLIGAHQIPSDLKRKLTQVRGYDWVETTIQNFINVLKLQKG